MIEVVSLGWWRLTKEIYRGLTTMKVLFKGAEKELEQIEGIFAEVDPYFLLLTTLVSIFHLALEIMAFSTDINFWRKRGEGSKGISPSSLGLSLMYSFFQISQNEWREGGREKSSETAS